MVGFGPVGLKVSLHGPTNLGALYAVVDLDPVRLVQAQHDGWRITTMEDALSTASVIVTATGFDGVVGADQNAPCRRRAILVNVGHSDRWRIDIDHWLDEHERTTVRRAPGGAARVGERRLLLLNRGSLVNLAAGLGIGAPRAVRDPLPRRSCGSGSTPSSMTTGHPSGQRCPALPHPLEAHVSALALATASPSTWPLTEP